MEDKLILQLAGARVGWVWAAQFRINFDCRSEDFRDWKSLKKWAFDPEFGIERKQRIYLADRTEEVPLLWPHAAIKILGLDFAIGFCIRGPITHLKNI